MTSGPPPAFRQALNIVAEGIVLFDAEARLIMANRAFQAGNPRLSGIAAPGIGWDLFLNEAAARGVFPRAVCDRLGAIESDLLDSGADLPPVLFDHPGGGVCELRLSPTDDGGFVLSQRHAREDRDTARDFEILLSKVLEASPACLVMSRIGDGQIIYRSPAATELLGQAKSSFAHFASRVERADFVTALLPDARVDDMRFTGLRADGTPFPGEISARLIDYGGEEVVVASLEDLTEKLAVEAELAQQREQIFQSDKMSALGELLAGVAHELNNPLSIIVGNAEILQEDMAGTPAEPRVNRLAAAATRCVNIVRSFLAMAREEPLQLGPRPLAEVLQVAEEATATLLTERGIRLDWTLEVDLPPVLADPVQLPQVFINLITNAAHAIEAGGAGDMIRITAAQDRDGRVRVLVSDNGPGVPDAIRSRIFDPLFTTKEGGKGTGVGLTFCHRIVSGHGGEISLAPARGTGATFRITLRTEP